MNFSFQKAIAKINDSNEKSKLSPVFSSFYFPFSPPIRNLLLKIGANSHSVNGLNKPRIASAPFRSGRYPRECIFAKKRMP